MMVALRTRQGRAGRNTEVYRGKAWKPSHAHRTQCMKPGKQASSTKIPAPKRQDSLIDCLQHAKRHVHVGTFFSHESSKSGGLQAWRMTQNAIRSSEGWIHAAAQEGGTSSAFARSTGDEKKRHGTRSIVVITQAKKVSVREGERDTCVGPSEQAGTVHGRAELAVAVWKRFGVSGQRVNNEQ